MLVAHWSRRQRHGTYCSSPGWPSPPSWPRGSLAPHHARGRSHCREYSPSLLHDQPESNIVIVTIMIFINFFIFTSQEPLIVTDFPIFSSRCKKKMNFLRRKLILWHRTRALSTFPSIEIRQWNLLVFRIQTFYDWATVSSKGGCLKNLNPKPEFWILCGFMGWNGGLCKLKPLYHHNSDKPKVCIFYNPFRLLSHLILHTGAAWSCMQWFIIKTQSSPDNPGTGDRQVRWTGDGNRENILHKPYLERVWGWVDAWGWGHFQPVSDVHTIVLWHSLESAWKDTNA